MALLNCYSKFLATAEPMHAAPWVCRRFRLDAALRLRWSSMYLDRIVVVRCEEYITCAMSHRTGTQVAVLSIWTVYIPGAKTRIPAELVTCEHICDST